MVAIELLAIAGILVFQPLIGLLWLYVAFRLTAGYFANRAEQAVDGRIEKIEEKLRGSE